VEKKLAEKVEQVKLENPDSEVGLWSEDEARFGLQAIIKKRWAKRGSRPAAELNPNYEWTLQLRSGGDGDREKFLSDAAESASGFGGDIFTGICRILRILETEDRHCDVGRRTGTSGAAQDSRRNRTVSNSGTSGIRVKDCGRRLDQW